MAWALNEALTDLSVVPESLALLYGVSGSEEGRRRLRDFLSDSGVNLDLLDDEDIEEHGGDAYAWLAADLIAVARRLGFLAPSEPGAPFPLTELGRTVADERVSPESGVAAGLFRWQLKVRGGVATFRPIPRLLEVLDALDAEKDGPCPGLLLPEFALTMDAIERGDSAQACLKAVRDWRRKALPNGPLADQEDSRMAICDHLAGRLTRQDVVGARATSSNILASGIAAYGAIFGVQYMASNLPFLEALGAPTKQENPQRSLMNKFHGKKYLSPARSLDLALRFDEAAGDS